MQRIFIIQFNLKTQSPKYCNPEDDDIVIETGRQIKNFQLRNTNGFILKKENQSQMVQFYRSSLTQIFMSKLRSHSIAFTFAVFNVFRSPLNFRSGHSFKTWFIDCITVLSQSQLGESRCSVILKIDSLFQKQCYRVL